MTKHAPPARRHPNVWTSLGMAAVFSGIALAIGDVGDGEFIGSWALMTLPLWVVIIGAERLAYKAGFDDGFDLGRPK